MKTMGVTLGLWLVCSLFTIALSAVNSPCRTTESLPGTCIPLPQCQRLFDLYSKPRPLPAATIQLLRAEQCGSLNRQPLVCCRDEPEPNTLNNRGQTVPETPVDVSSHRNVGLINPEFCGLISSARRIIGGNVTGVFEMPWMVMLKYRTTKGAKTEESFKCGGALINTRYVLTAAHCISNTPKLKLVSVRLGDHDTSTDEDCEVVEGVRKCAPPPQNINVESFIKHPGYTATALRDDIGLVRLAAPADLDKETIQPICLPVGPAEQNKNLDRLKLIVAGWGITEAGVASPALLKVSVPVVPTAACQAVFQDFNLTITERQLCAGGSKLKQDSCRGDSGGPIKSFGIINGDGGMVQYGVVSYGYRFCGTEGIPAVYTRVSPYMKWILDNMEP